MTDTTTQTTAAQPTQAAPAAAPVQAAAPAAQESSIDWGSIAKNTGIFVAGAAVGAAGKWAWDHFMG